MTEASLRKSTNVRFNTLTGGQLAIRLGFGALERLAPGLGARLALRLWCTPPRGRRPAADPVPPGARRSVVPLGGRPIEVRTWGSGPTVHLVHGWGGHRAQLHAFVPALVAAGYQVVAHDALGHGDSPAGPLGRLSTLAELADSLVAVSAATGPAHAVVAHSLGACASAVAVLDGLPVRRLVLIAPLADPTGYTREFAAALGFGERVRSRMLDRMARLVSRPLADFDIRSRGAAATGMPSTLIVHDRDDKEARFADGVAINAAWPAAELMATAGLGHRRILGDPAVVAATVDFLRASGHGTGSAEWS